MSGPGKRKGETQGIQTLRCMSWLGPTETKLYVRVTGAWNALGPWPGPGEAMALDRLIRSRLLYDYCSTVGK